MRCRTSRARDAALPALAAAAQAEVEPLTRVLVRDGGKIFPLMVDAIECLRSDTKYTAIVSQGRSHLVRLPLCGVREAPEPEPLPQDQSRLHRQPRLRRGDGSGRELAARGAAEGRHAGHREPRGLASTPGGFAMKKTRFLLARWRCSPGCPWPSAQTDVSGRSTPTGPFDAIEISGSADVRFTQGPSRPGHRRAATKTVQRAVVLEVRNGKLRIDLSGAWRFWDANRMRIEVQARDLTRVTISGAGDFARGRAGARRTAHGQSSPAPARPASNGSTPSTLSFQISGKGDGQVAGSTKDLFLKISGHGEFRGEDLRSELCEIAGERRRRRPGLDGAGHLRIAVAGAAKIDYWGTPQVQRSSPARRRSTSAAPSRRSRAEARPTRRPGLPRSAPARARPVGACSASSFSTGRSPRPAGPRAPHSTAAVNTRPKGPSSTAGTCRTTDPPTSPSLRKACCDAAYVPDRDSRVGEFRFLLALWGNRRPRSSAPRALRSAACTFAVRSRPSFSQNARVTPWRLMRATIFSRVESRRSAPPRRRTAGAMSATRSCLLRPPGRAARCGRRRGRTAPSRADSASPASSGRRAPRHCPRAPRTSACALDAILGEDRQQGLALERLDPAAFEPRPGRTRRAASTIVAMMSGR